MLTAIRREIHKDSDDENESENEVQMTSDASRFSEAKHHPNSPPWRCIKNHSDMYTQYKNSDNMH